MNFSKTTLVIAIIAVILLGCGGEDTKNNSDSGSDDTETGTGPDTSPIHELNLIPVPVSVEKDVGYLHLNQKSSICVSAGAKNVGDLLAGYLRGPTGYPLEVVETAPGQSDISLEIDAELDSLGPEGYRIEVDDAVATITSSTEAGLFYACQTLRQLMPVELGSKSVVEDVEWRIPKVTVEDYPRFEWRGAMLDVARHFFGVEDVKRFIDLMVFHKLNRFHIHLTDDQGWRIQIDSWPDLTTIGGSTNATGGSGGFYTQDDFTEIVEYASERFIIVIPEVDMPGHVNSALASYAELNESGETTTLPGGWPPTSLWLEAEISMEFAEDVITEVAALTPGPYYHIGGDEAIETPQDLYDVFIEDVQDIVTAQGKTMIGWDEISSTDLQTPVVAQYWYSVSKAVAAVQKGAKIISSPGVCAYLDMKYDESTTLGLDWAGYVEVDQAYNWDPVMSSLKEEDILGVESPLWTETVHTTDDMDFLVFPRLCGHSEIGWSPVEGRSWDEYRDRMGFHGARLEAMGVNYYQSPLIDWVSAP